MLFREIVAVCSEYHTKHNNYSSGKIRGLRLLNQVVCIVTVGF